MTLEEAVNFAEIAKTAAEKGRNGQEEYTYQQILWCLIQDHLDAKRRTG